MDVYFDHGLGLLVSSPNNKTAITRLEFRYDQTSELRLRHCRAGVVFALADGATGKFGLKERGKYDADFIVADLTWEKVEEEDDVYYRFAPDFTTDELKALLGVNPPTTSNDKATVTLMGDIRFVENGRTTITQTILAVVSNIVVRGTEGMGPNPNPVWGSPSDYARIRLGITGLTGGGATNLDGLATVTGDFSVVGSVVLIVLGGALNAYQLVTGTDAEASPSVIRPDDFNISTNAKVWKLAL